MKDVEELDLHMQEEDVKLIYIIMELIEIRRRAIEYCESLTGLTSREIEIAYKAYVAALLDKMNNKIEPGRSTRDICDHNPTSNISSSTGNYCNRFSRNC